MSQYDSYRSANFRYVDGVHYSSRNLTDKLVDTVNGRLGFAKVTQRGARSVPGDNHVEIIWEDESDTIEIPLKDFMKRVRDGEIIEA